LCEISISISSPSHRGHVVIGVSGVLPGWSVAHPSAGGPPT
jgi:hypothetical protein